MSKRKIPPVPVIDPAEDPTILKTDLTIGDDTYTLAFDYRSLAIGEKELRALGYDVYLLQFLPFPTMEQLPVLVAASLHKFHPEVTYEEAVRLVQPWNAQMILNKMMNSWAASIPEQKKPVGNVEGAE